MELSMDILMWKGRDFVGSQPRQRISGYDDRWKEKNWTLPGMNRLIGYPIQSSQHWKAVYVQTEKLTQQALHTHMHKYTHT